MLGCSEKGDPYGNGKAAHSSVKRNSVAIAALITNATGNTV